MQLLLLQIQIKINAKKTILSAEVKLLSKFLIYLKVLL